MIDEIYEYYSTLMASVLIIYSNSEGHDYKKEFQR